MADDDMRIVISSGHWKQGTTSKGAKGYLDEVDEARKVVEAVADYLVALDVDVITFHDDTSKSQNENLKTIVNFHNSCERDLDISVHFNAYQTTSKPMGTECLYLTQDNLATVIAGAISVAGGLINRGSKYRSDLYFLSKTTEPAILLEVAFVDSSTDAELYAANFHAICRAIAETVSGRTLAPAERPEDLPPLEPELPLERYVQISGPCSWFGGPDDMGVAPDEGLAFIYDVEEAPYLFLEDQPRGTSGLARRLNPDVYYVACRWDYEITPKTMLARGIKALVKAPRTGLSLEAYPADWGPHVDTGRAADISKGLMEALGIETDDIVEVIYPSPRLTKPSTVA